MKSKPESKPKKTPKAKPGPKPGPRQYERDPEKVRQLLEWLGALILNAEMGEITISTEAASRIVDILSSLPEGKIGRPKAWSSDVEIRAVFDLLGGKSVPATARWVAAETGQDEKTAARRLADLKKSRRFKIWQKT